VGTCVEVESELTLTTVVRTGRSARVDDGGGASEFVNRLGIRCRVAVPIIVEGCLWGSISAGTNREQFPADAEQRMAAFTELAGTAIANADSCAELAASRRRIVSASDDTRRRSSTGMPMPICPTSSGGTPGRGQETDHRSTRLLQPPYGRVSR